MRKVFNHTIAILGSLFGIIMIANIFIFADKEQYFCKKNFLCSNKIMLLIGLFLVIICCLMVGRSPLFSWFEKMKSNTLFTASLILFFCQLWIAWNIYFETGWDCWSIVDTARSFVEGNLRNGSYYGTYPNNIVLMGIFSMILKGAQLIGVENGYFVLVVCNVILLNLSGLMTANITYRLTLNKKIVAIVWISFSILGSLSGWMVVPYSDVWALFFVILTFYFYGMIREKSTWSPWVVLGILFFISAQIKPPTLIGLIAIVMVEFIFPYRSNWKKYVKIGMMVMVTVILLGTFSKVTTKMMESLGVNTEQKVTFMHYLMIGLHEESLGAISEEDLLFSVNIPTVEKRKEQNLKVVKERLHNYGLSGYIKFLQKKLLMNTNDGSFAWGLEGNFYKVIPKETTKTSGFFRNMYYNIGSYHDADGGKKHLVLLSLQQLIWLCMLLSLCGVTLSNQKKTVIIEDSKSNTVRQLENVAILNVIGIILFTLFFEARARYLFMSLPMFTICMGVGLQHISQIGQGYLSLFNKKRNKIYQGGNDGDKQAENMARYSLL